MGNGEWGMGNGEWGMGFGIRDSQAVAAWVWWPLGRVGEMRELIWSAGCVSGHVGRCLTVTAVFAARCCVGLRVAGTVLRSRFAALPCESVAAPPRAAALDQVC
ncbi:hypothetical protein EIQ10_00590 [Xanthomonas campestris pv. campestris]